MDYSAIIIIDDEPQFEMKILNPKILILGNGIAAYLLAVLLTIVHKINKNNIVITGRDYNKLKYFVPYVGSRVNIIDIEVDKLPEYLINQGKPGNFDIVFECVGSPAVETNIQLALNVLNKKGILALFGLTDQNIMMDFKKIITNEIYVKGVYRSSLKAYSESLKYIEYNKKVQKSLRKLIDDTPIRGNREFHDVEDKEHLEEIFKTASERKRQLGRIIVRNLQ